ncbi:MAG: OmpA family protein [Bacteroidota bacterium]
MLKKLTTLITAFSIIFIFVNNGFGQNESSLETQPAPYLGATPAHMWEFGLHTGVPLVLGDIDFTPGIAGGFHFRRALDYVFSLRSEFMVGRMNNKDNNDGRTRTTWRSGTFEIIASLNNLVWSSSKSKKTNLYGLVAIGVNSFKVDVIRSLSPEILPKEYSWQSHGGAGIGFSVRLNERLNISAESKAFVMFGKDGDRLDAVERQEGDVLSYTSLRLNYNLGKKGKKAEPLYWVNPMDRMLQDVTELKNRPVFDLTDTDKDGVIDLLDQDNTTPAGVQVDTRGLPLDSDGDGIPNHEDVKPYIHSDDNGVVSGQAIASDADIDRIITQRLYQYDQTGEVPEPSTEGKGGRAPILGAGKDYNSRLAERNRAERAAMANWFLPLIHFDIDSYRLRYVDYGNLSSIAKMMKANPDLRIVVTGYTDKTASKEYNKYLSYQRAKTTIEHFVKIHGVDRSRFVLQYSGEEFPLVPSTGSNLMNRRVEFRAAVPEDLDMPPAPHVLNNKSKKRGF